MQLTLVKKMLIMNTDFIEVKLKKISSYLNEEMEK